MGGTRMTSEEFDRRVHTAAEKTRYEKAEKRRRCNERRLANFRRSRGEG